VYDRYRNRCASGSMDNTVKIWNVTTGECLASLSGHTSLVGLLGISPNYTVSAAADASLRIWNSGDHELVHTLTTHGGAITCFQHDESKVVSGSDGTLKLWDIRTGQYIRDLVIGISSVWQVAFHGNLLVAASNRGGSTVFDVFDFGALDHPSGVDNEKLDKLRRPPWERLNPREPQAYQSEEDELEYSPDSPFLVGGGVKSEFGGDSGGWGTEVMRGQRRSDRLAGRSVGNVSLGRDVITGSEGRAWSTRGERAQSGSTIGGSRAEASGSITRSARRGEGSRSRNEDTAGSGPGPSTLTRSRRGLRAIVDENGSPTPVGYSGSLTDLGVGVGGVGGGSMDGMLGIGMGISNSGMTFGWGQEGGGEMEEYDESMMDIYYPLA
jgi:F-box and WD-40 domain protein CDC4